MDLIKWNTPFPIIAGTTLRTGGYSKGECASMNMALNVKDEVSDVLKNRQLLADYLKTDFKHMISPTQTHSTNLQKVTLADGGKGMYSLEDAFYDIDATYTRDKGLVLLTYHADCIPVLLYDKKEELICAIHSGWKGNVHEITLKTLRYLNEHENCQPENIYAYIGPSLGFSQFEARGDIIELVDQMEISSKQYYVDHHDGTYHLDAKGLVKEQLTYFDVPLENITIDEGCTKSDPERFFSYRNSHACGRHASFIMMTK